MKKSEFLQVLAYLEAGIQKTLPKESIDVYADLLADLPVDVLRLAAQRVILAHKWPTFPSVAEIREAAIDVARGQVKELSAEEAWGQAWGAAKRIDPDINGSTDRVLSKLAPAVAEAMRTFGVRALCFGSKGESLGTVRAQFRATYEQIVARDRQRALLPKKLAAAIEHKSRAAETVRQIGLMDSP